MPYKHPEDKQRWEDQPEQRAKRLLRAKQYYRAHKEKISDYNRRYYEEKKMATREAHRINNIARRERIADGNSQHKPVRVEYHECVTPDYFTMGQYRIYKNDFTDASVWIDGIRVETQERLI